MSSDKTYDITKTNTVIDLNENLTNFSCSFNISILNGEDKEIEVAVIDPMDENEVEYQKLKGGNSGSIEKTEGPYKSFMLALKLPEDSKEESLKVHVSINVQSLDQQQDNSDFIESTLDNYENHKKKINWFKIILVLIILAIGGYMIYYFYTKDNKKSPYSSRNFGKNTRNSFRNSVREYPPAQRSPTQPFGETSSPTTPFTHMKNNQLNSSEIAGNSFTFNTDSKNKAPYSSPTEPLKKSKNIFEKMNDIEL